ncbi:enoyl-CoA hydratase/isomerase family protein [Virgibacillus litoralis]|uniref:Enoyl-CoA hydratase/carnithine racemase n=1 Tax=Virgibacillus litoralis TaxID=578221 RepID=A0ABS4HI71_9BACI|nr:enoyl-CoA hydratase/isomerase family protein [Virgibacillus litoralis]MBP1950622.1 enoyl-CoA hydratase/carnithine racemase [Virgibacillus litoralis]
METIQYNTYEDDGYAVIQLHRPKKRNAVSNEMVNELKNVLESAKQSSLKFLVITGAGTKMFCAGGDLHNLHGELSTDEAFSTLYPMKEVLYDIVSFPVPTICLLNGDALGGGCEIATACDFRIARENTKFGFVQTKLGITPGWGGGALLYEKVHPSFAYQWLMEGEVYNASYLLKQGWLHKIASDELWTDHQKLLNPYLSKSFDQMNILKMQYRKKLSILGFSALMDDEVRNCAKLWESQEHKDAVQQFISR